MIVLIRALKFLTLLEEIKSITHKSINIEKIDKNSKRATLNIQNKNYFVFEKNWIINNKIEEKKEEIPKK